MGMTKVYKVCNRAGRQVEVTVPENEPRWVVRCQVSGGVTGTRTSLLKGRDGTVQEFATREEAAAAAMRLTTQQNENIYRTAQFAYWPEEAQ
jgi:hypothetical protein